MEQQPLEYIPLQPTQQQAPKSEYVLVNDLNGPPVLRGPQMLKAYTQDKEGKQIVLQFQVPYPPKSNCKKCRGRGYIGIIYDKKQEQKPIVGICYKCYPM